jgi:hypothetical protein
MLRHRLSPWILVFAVLVFSVGSTQGATMNLDAPTIKAALRTTDIEDKGFVEKVIRLMNKGKLPRALVETTFDWARRKNEHRFQYFKQALTVQATKLGLSLDETPDKVATKSYWQWTYPWYVKGTTQ